MYHLRAAASAPKWDAVTFCNQFFILKKKDITFGYSLKITLIQWKHLFLLRKHGMGWSCEPFLQNHLPLERCHLCENFPHDWFILCYSQLLKVSCHMSLCVNCSLQAATCWLFIHFEWPTWHWSETGPFSLWLPLCGMGSVKGGGSPLFGDFQEVLQGQLVCPGLLRGLNWQAILKGREEGRDLERTILFWFQLEMFLKLLLRAALNDEERLGYKSDSSFSLSLIALALSNSFQVRCNAYLTCIQFYCKFVHVYRDRFCRIMA